MLHRVVVLDYFRQRFDELAGNVLHCGMLKHIY